MRKYKLVKKVKIKKRRKNNKKKTLHMIKVKLCCYNKEHVDAQEMNTKSNYFNAYELLKMHKNPLHSVVQLVVINAINLFQRHRHIKQNHFHRKAINAFPLHLINVYFRRDCRQLFVKSSSKSVFIIA